MPDLASAAAAEVEGVSAACLFVRRALFEALGGFDTGYLLEDEFAEIDLCVRARERVSICLLDPTLTMRHLEGQSATAFVAAEPLLSQRYLRDKVHFFNSWRLCRRAAAGTAR